MTERGEENTGKMGRNGCEEGKKRLRNENKRNNKEEKTGRREKTVRRKEE